MTQNIRYNQHFLVSQAVIQQLIESAEVTAHDVALEIGPGFGAITRQLAGKADRIIAVELDPAMLEPLSQLTNQFDNVEVIWGNILEIALPRFDKIVSNIPFNIIEPLIEKLKLVDFASAALITGIRFAQAAQAQPDDKEFGKLALLTQCYFHVEVVQRVEPTAFEPRPRVDSAILVLKPRPKADLLALPSLYLMRELFEQRDKILKNALREAIIRYAATADQKVSKREALAIIAEMIPDQAMLSSYLEHLNNQQIAKLYHALEQYVFKL